MKGGNIMTRNLFIGSLSYNVTSAQLEEHFAKAGNVVSARAITDRNTGLGKGFGFVEMGSEDEARYAIKTLNNTTIEGRTIIVKEATPRE